MAHFSTAAPSPELVERVRDLYHKRVPDVRFLIPVLIGLSKVSIILFCHLKFCQQDNQSNSKALFFLILGLRIFFLKILRSEEGKKFKKITKFFFLFNLKHIWIGEKK